MAFSPLWENGFNGNNQEHQGSICILNWAMTCFKNLSSPTYNNLCHPRAWVQCPQSLWMPGNLNSLCVTRASSDTQGL